MDMSQNIWRKPYCIIRHSRIQTIILILIVIIITMFETIVLSGLLEVCLRIKGNCCKEWNRLNLWQGYLCFNLSYYHSEMYECIYFHPIYSMPNPVYHHHHHYVVPLAQISLTLSRHFSQSFIAFGRSSGLHPVSSQSCCMYVRAGHPAFARPYVGVHRSTSLMSSSLLLQQCPACLVCLTWIVFMMGGRWLYSWCFVGCCSQDWFNIARNILAWLPSSFFSSCFVSVQVVHPYSGIKLEETAFHFISQVWFPYDW